MNPVYMNLILQTLLSIQFITLLLFALTFSPLFLHNSANCPTITLRSSSDSPQRIKSYAYKRSENLQSLPSSTNSTPLFHESHSPSSHPYLHLLHRCIHIYIEQSRRHDTTLSYPTIYPLLLTLPPPFTLIQAELSTYILLILLNNLSPTSYILNSCHRASLFTLSYKTHMHSMFFLSCFLTYFLQCEYLIYTIPPQSKISLLIMNETPSDYELYLLRSLHIFF